MPVLPHRKNKVSLSDFNYLREIELRLFFSGLSNKEVPILQEIVDDSLKMSLLEFSKRVNISAKTLQPLLKKLEECKFLKIEGDHLIVDKEQRKAFETFLIKFEEDFEPGMEYLRSLLNRIPTNIQANWYHLPRNCDDVFQTLVETTLSTPKSYKQYIDQLEYDHPHVGAIIKELYSSPELLLPATKVMKKYRLDLQAFHEAVLLMEYNLVGCLAYIPTVEGWEEVITPFAEFKNYQNFLQSTTSKPISGKVKRFHVEDFGFVLDMSTKLEALMHTPAPAKGDSPYSEQIIERLIFHHLAKEEAGKLKLRESATSWLAKSIEERALSLSRHPTAVEKGLNRLILSGWTYVDDFMRGFTGVLTGKEKIALRNKGKKWGYFRPEYNEEEQALIRTTLTKRLFEAGFIALGEHQGKECFIVTTFGRKYLEE